MDWSHLSLSESAAPVAISAVFANTGRRPNSFARVLEWHTKLT